MIGWRFCPYMSKGFPLNYTEFFQSPSLGPHSAVCPGSLTFTDFTKRLPPLWLVVLEVNERHSEVVRGPRRVSLGYSYLRLLPTWVTSFGCLFGSSWRTTAPVGQPSLTAITLSPGSGYLSAFSTAELVVDSLMTFVLVLLQFFVDFSKAGSKFCRWSLYEIVL